MFEKLFSLVFITVIFLQCNLVVWAEIIEDEVAQQSFIGQNLSKPVYKPEIIEDEALTVFKGQNLSKSAVNTAIIEDEIAQMSFAGQNLLKPVFKLKIVEDDVVLASFQGKNLSKPVFHCKLIDENAEIVRVLVKADHYTIHSKNLKLNQQICFIVVNDVKKDGKLFIRKNTPIKAVVETITNAGWGGDPCELILGHFTTTDVHGNKIDLAGEIKKNGANRAYWVRPIFYVGESLPPYSTPLLVVFFIKGGNNAKITPRKKYTLYYE